MNRLRFLGVLFLSVSPWPAASAGPEAAIRVAASDPGLARDPYWLRLLHVRSNLFGVRRSEIDDPAFFLSPRGRVDPRAELIATVEAFLAGPADGAEPAACRYPARYQWLSRKLPIETLRPAPDCPRFEDWRQRLDARGVTVVFASFYLNNPSSLYGHTFLRLRRGEAGHDSPLLDYTVNFSAEVTSSNGLVFAWKGLTGGYRGKFSTLPFHMKVQEYSNLESRDLWEYDLSLSSAAVDRLVRHLWEIGPASTAYYFFNKNCSYQLLPLLEVAEPDLRLTRGFKLKAIPADTLQRLLDQPAWIGAMRFRPSHRRRMLAARAELDPAGIRDAESWAAGQMPAGWADRAEASQASILDAAYQYHRFRYGFKRDRPAEVEERERAILMARSRIDPDAVSEVDVPRPAPPQAQPGTTRAAYGFGWTSKTRFEEFGWRFALFDEDDPAAGFLPGSRLEMIHLKARHDWDRKKWWLHRLTLVDLVSQSPWDRWVRKPSWRIKTGWDSALDLGRDPENSLYYRLNAGSGLSWKPPIFDMLIYAMADADLGVGGIFRDSCRFGGGGSGGAQVHPLSFWGIHVQSKVLHYPLGDPGPVTRLRLIQTLALGPRVQLRGTLERQNQHKEAMASLLFYF